MRIAINTRLVIRGKMDGIGWFTSHTVALIVRQHPEHQFFLFFDRRPDPDEAFREVLGLPNVSTIMLSPQARHPLLWYVYFNFSTRVALIRYKIDLYLSPDGFIPLHPTVPTVNVVHDINFEHFDGALKPLHEWYMRRYFPRYACQATRVATVSEFSRQDISSTYRIPLERIGVVYNGSDFLPTSEMEQRRTREQYADGHPYFIFVSTIHRRKNLQGVLRAFDRFKEGDSKGVRLLVAGARQYWKGELKESFGAMRYASEVRFLGHVDNQVLQRLVSSAMALVYPSFFEGFGIPVLDAFRAHSAVITANVTSLPEVAGDAALLVNPQNDSEIAEAMTRLANDEKLRQQLIARGDERSKFFSWQRTADLLWAEMMKAVEEQTRR